MHSGRGIAMAIPKQKERILKKLHLLKFLLFIIYFILFI